MRLDQLFAKFCTGNCNDSDLKRSPRRDLIHVFIGELDVAHVTLCKQQHMRMLRRNAKLDESAIPIDPRGKASRSRRRFISSMLPAEAPESSGVFDQARMARVDVKVVLLGQQSIGETTCYTVHKLKQCSTLVAGMT